MGLGVCGLAGNTILFSRPGTTALGTDSAAASAALGESEEDSRLTKIQVDASPPITIIASRSCQTLVFFFRGDDLPLARPGFDIMKQFYHTSQNHSTARQAGVTFWLVPEGSASRCPTWNNPGNCRSVPL